MSEFDPSQPLDAVDHERFSQFVAASVTPLDAYKKVYPKSSQKSAQANAYRLIETDRVKRRVKFLQSESSQDCRLSKKQRMDMLCDVLETSPGKIDQDSPLCQSYKHSRKVVGRGEEAEEWETDEIKICDKMKAHDILNRMCGDYAPEKHQDVTEWTPEQKAVIANMAAQSKSALAGMGIGKAKKL